MGGHRTVIPAQAGMTKQPYPLHCQLRQSRLRGSKIRSGSNWQDTTLIAPIHRLGRKIPKHLLCRSADTRIVVIQKLAAERSGGVQCQPGNGTGGNIRGLQFPALFELPVIGHLLGRHGVARFTAQDGLHAGIHHSGTHGQRGHIPFLGSQYPGKMV